MAKRQPKSKKQGFSLDDIAKLLVGEESEKLFKEIPKVEAPMGGVQGGVAQQFGAAGLGPQARKLLQQMSLAGEGVARSNVADLFGVKDAYLAEKNQSPVNALWALLSVSPLGTAGKFGKTLKSIASTLRTGNRNPRLEVGSRTVPSTKTTGDALLDAYIFSIIGKRG
jgi:hypothetical protein